VLRAAGGVAWSRIAVLRLREHDAHRGDHGGQAT
jgi:hypothetical protein